MKRARVSSRSSTAESTRVKLSHAFLCRPSRSAAVFVCGYLNDDSSLQEWVAALLRVLLLQNATFLSCLVLSRTARLRRERHG